MVASDLDGTIVRDDYTISERTLAALRACADAGVLVVFVTGRPPRWMPVIAERTGHVGLAVCANGALVYDMGADRVVEVRPIPTADVRAMVNLLRDHVPGCSFGLELADGFAMERSFGRHPDDARVEQAIGPIDELLRRDFVVAKLLCRLPLPGASQDAGAGPRSTLVKVDESPSVLNKVDESLRLARDLLEGLGEAVFSDPSWRLLEIGATGVTKATTLAMLAAEHGIGPDDVVAFGDMPNDVPMLRWAGRGYAMDGGHPEAIAAADAVAPPCDEDGVAQVLEGLLAAARA
jgi:hydroxymethylpyrimidine pyrophosphatase-like HAD family hydrolase